MPKICYTPKKFSTAHAEIITVANGILVNYAQAGYDLTLRQLYYRFVADGHLDRLGFKPDPATGSTNNMRSYKRLGDILNDARLAGKVDWDHITDRTRNLRTVSTWDSPGSIIRAVADQFKLDKWAGQKYRPEVWVEKDALAGIMERVCDEEEVPWFSCRGYTSQSEVWSAARRLMRHARNGQTPVILHFGDHDPSGIDMTRDIRSRLELFTGGEVDLQRLALNMDQVERFNPPPNPAKTTDSRAEGYIAEYGTESWELDALDPDTLAGLVRGAIEGMKDQAAWDEVVEQEEENKRLLQAVSDQWETLTDGL